MIVESMSEMRSFFRRPLMDVHTVSIAVPDKIFRACLAISVVERGDSMKMSQASLSASQSVLPVVTKC